MKGCMTRQTPSALLSALGFLFLYKKMSQGAQRAGTQKREKLQFNSLLWPSISCVTLGMGLNLSDPQFPHL